MISIKPYDTQVAPTFGGDNPIRFLKEEVYRLGELPGLRSLPPGPERNFLTLSWGPIIYRTSYAPETKRLLPVFLRHFNNCMIRALHRTLTASDEEAKILTTTYSSKVFNARDTYADMNEEAIRQVFHDFKVSLGIPETELPSRLRICLMIDDSVLSQFKRVLDLSSMVEGDADVGGCWVKVVEENFPDSRMSDRPIANPNIDYVKEHGGSYDGWTMIALEALGEVFDGLQQMKCLVDYHQEGQVYLGDGEWGL
ncbi:unnamed protein product [Penicillium glandicola]